MPFNGNVLKKLREAKKMSADDIMIELSKQGFRTTRQTIYNWENGKHDPSAEGLMAISKYFNLPINRFF